MKNSFRDNPQRAPHWRWLRATQIDAGGLRASRRVDGPEGFKWIRRAVAMKRRYEQFINNPAKLYALSKYDAALFWAHSVWIEDKMPTKWAIEAHILADESPADIAKKVGTDPAVIEAYESVFFDVREKLNNKEYVLNVVIKDSVTRGLSERHYDLLWKIFGYQCGPFVLDSIIGRFTNPYKPQKEEDVAGFFNDAAIGIIKQKATIAALSVPVNSHTQTLLLEAFVKYVEIERTTDNASKAQVTIVENIGAMLDALPFRVGTKLDSEQEKMVPFDNNPAELRNNEMMIVAAGGTLDNRPLLENLKFPGG